MLKKFEIKLILKIDYIISKNMKETRQNSLKGIIERNEERGNKILSDGVEIQADVPKMIQN